LKGAFPDFGEHVLLVQKSLKKLKGAHFNLLVQRPPNTALWQGSCLIQIKDGGQSDMAGSMMQNLL
jgi:hypothetical protein